MTGAGDTPGAIPAGAAEPAAAGPGGGTPRRTAAHRQPTHAQAARILAGRDPVIARLVAQAGLPRLGRPQESHFAALLRAIVYQQLAGAAAAAIHGRLVSALGGDIRPEVLIALPDAALRTAGLSAGKVASLLDLASKVLDGTVVLSPRGLARLSDEEIKTRLSSVRGIGPWTADMFLLFQLRRLDVWPAGDLGVRRGYGLAWGVPVLTARELQGWPPRTTWPGMSRSGIPTARTGRWPPGTAGGPRNSTPAPPAAP